jgi:hypothetical protein
VGAKLATLDVDARDKRWYDGSKKRLRRNKKSPAGNRGAFDLDIVKEDVPTLADLAATYSSKP